MTVNTSLKNDSTRWCSGAPFRCFFVLLIVLMLGLGACAKKDDPIVEPSASESVKAVPSYSPIDPDLGQRYRKLAPADWELLRTEKASASFSVNISGRPGGDAVVVGGAILLDGRFERYLSPLDFSPAVIARERERFDAEAAEYPNVEGFERVIASPSLGFDSNRGVQRRSIKYLNRENGIYCRGTHPGMLRCLWGEPETRMVLNFHSDQTEIALKYLVRELIEG